MLAENPEIRAELDEQYRYVLVDEFQDTNLAQYQIAAAISRDYPNLCATGDPDQSIYGWRGARIENILRFEADYPQAAVVRLEDNFRSTKAILRAADSLIAHNVRRKAKTMRTDNPEGPPVELLVFQDSHAEAVGIARLLREAFDAGSLRWSEAAIFYRVNALSRELEHALSQHHIPYQVAAGFAFYERAEVKDLLAYLRLIANPRDRGAFVRVVNVPARGIGKKSLKRLLEFADTNRLAPLEAAARAVDIPGLARRAARELTSFAGDLAALSEARIESVREVLELVLERSQYTRGWKESRLEQDQQRLANVNELVSAAAQYDAAGFGVRGHLPGTETGVQGFLEATALVADVDSVDGEAERVTLMTLHAAKGLEFPVVYIVGLEVGLLPHDRAVRSDERSDYEEERRLLFVGMTRARQRLALTRSLYRADRGRVMQTIPSDFLREAGLAEIRWPAQDFQRPGEAAFDAHEPHPDHEGSQVEFDDEAAPQVGRRRAKADAAAAIPRPRLMTGADLLAGLAREAETVSGFAPGMTVRHPSYGLGTVVELGGFSRTRTITVVFEDDGRRETFVAGKNPLQPVGAG
jgi:DNA helicase-2/ATP-dependent DNA helicase PcrA